MCKNISPALMSALMEFRAGPGSAIQGTSFEASWRGAALEKIQTLIGRESGNWGFLDWYVICTVFPDHKRFLVQLFEAAKKRSELAFCIALCEVKFRGTPICNRMTSQYHCMDPAPACELNELGLLVIHFPIPLGGSPWVYLFHQHCILPTRLAPFD